MCQGICAGESSKALKRTDDGVYLSPQIRRVRHVTYLALVSPGRSETSSRDIATNLDVLRRRPRSPACYGAATIDTA